MPFKKRAKGTLKVTLNELSQEIDLKSYLGRKPTASEKRAFAELATDTIENRTLDGQTINGGKFKKYSKAYADIKGVTRSSVDLFLDGDMLNGIGRRSSKEKTGTVFIRTCTLCGCAERLIIGFTEWRPFDPESNPLAPEFRGGEQPPDWFKEQSQQKQ